MKLDKRCPLLVKSENKRLYQNFTAGEAGWEYLNFCARKMKRNDTWTENTGDNEYCIVLLGGNFSVESDKGEWATVNGRKNVFSGLPHAQIGRASCRERV